MKFLLRAFLTIAGLAFALTLLWLPPAAQAQTLPPPTPTTDRLAKPTLPASPSQADLGAQDYWLYCSPCHGDKAQGLTDEFRLQYPVEDQNCWKSGCHGRRPYPNGWTIPTPVPALVGPEALTHFSDASALFAYMRLAMPFQTPGSLDEAAYWRIAAFLMRQNGYRLETAALDASNAAEAQIPRPTASPAAGKGTPSPASLPPAAGTLSPASPVPAQSSAWLFGLAGAALGAGLLFFLFKWKK